MRGLRLSSVSLACLLALGAGRVAADELRVSVTETLRAELRADNGNDRDDDDDYGIAVNRLNMVITGGPLIASLRLDATALHDAPTEAFKNDLRDERLTVRYHEGPWRLTFGDFYRQLGRGVLLSVRKVDEAGVDVSLRGGELGLGLGDHSIGIFAGRTNTANLDPISQKHVEDRDDVVAGLDTRWRLGELVQLGVFGVFLKPEEQVLASATEEDYSAGGGASAEIQIPGDWLSIYLETDLQQRRTAGVESRGKAVYLAADLLFTDWTFLVEGLLLDDVVQKGSTNSALGGRFDYNQPPTLERIDQEVSASTNVQGARLRAERLFMDGDLIVHANGTFRRNEPGAPDEVRTLHAYGGFELAYQDGDSRVAASGGYRDERQDDGRGRSMIHAEADWVQALGGRWSLHLSSSNELREQTVVSGTAGDETSFERGSLFAGVDLASAFGLTFELGFDTEKPEDTARNLFYAGHLVAHFTDWLDLRATGGTQRGGIKCISGVCRDLPEFAGGRAEVVARF